MFKRRSIFQPLNSEKYYTSTNFSINLAMYLFKYTSSWPPQEKKKFDHIQPSLIKNLSTPSSCLTIDQYPNQELVQWLHRTCKQLCADLTKWSCIRRAGRVNNVLMACELYNLYRRIHKKEKAIAVRFFPKRSLNWRWSCFTLLAK